MQLPENTGMHEALNASFTLEMHGYFYNDLNVFFKFDDYSVLEKYQRLLLEGIKTGNESIVTKRVEDIFEYINSLEHSNMNYLKNFYCGIINQINNIRLSVAQASNDRKVESINIVSLHSMINDSDSIHELNVLLKDVSRALRQK